MSGLFAFRRSSVNLDQVNPVGFKILLELLVRHRTAGWPRSATRWRPGTPDVPRRPCAWA